MQMNDGIHQCTGYMRVKAGVVTYPKLQDTRDGLDRRLRRISREEFLEELEGCLAPVSAMEKCYGEYNSFAVSEEDSNDYYAWYDNDR
jgi:hypothetical protein